MQSNFPFSLRASLRGQIATGEERPREEERQSNWENETERLRYIKKKQKRRNERKDKLKKGKKKKRRERNSVVIKTERHKSPFQTLRSENVPPIKIMTTITGIIEDLCWNRAIRFLYLPFFFFFKHHYVLVFKLFPFFFCVKSALIRTLNHYCGSFVEFQRDKTQQAQKIDWNHMVDKTTGCFSACKNVILCF